MQFAKASGFCTVRAIRRFDHARDKRCGSFKVLYTVVDRGFRRSLSPNCCLQDMELSTPGTTCDWLPKLVRLL